MLGVDGWPRTGRTYHRPAEIGHPHPSQENQTSGDGNEKTFASQGRDRLTSNQGAKRSLFVNVKMSEKF